MPHHANSEELHRTFKGIESGKIIQEAVCEYFFCSPTTKAQYESVWLYTVLSPHIEEAIVLRVKLVRNGYPLILLYYKC